MNRTVSFAELRSMKRAANLQEQALSVARSAAGSMGTMSNWSPRRLSWREEGSQRERVALRATDIAVNDAHGASIIDSITINTVGTGLWPRSTPNFKRLGITEEQAEALAETVEWEFEQWAREADARGVTDFYGLQTQNVWAMLVKGEFVNLPLMLRDPARRYALAVQTVDPRRLCTPAAMSAAPDVRDGIRLGLAGQPISYYLANPENGLFVPGLDISQFEELPPRRGHRPVVMHGFVAKEPEQCRGVSVFGPVMKLFRDKSDYLDFELVAAIVAANFPVWIEKSNAYDANPLPGASRGPFGSATNATGEQTVYRELTPGMIHYGNPGEKPTFPNPNRPSGNLPAFLETVLRAIGAGGGGMPYELVAKDFSKTNYSSARAALEEAWRVFGFTQDWLIKVFCQPLFEMVFEEAWLRSRIKLPAGAPDFYAARAEYCAAQWTVPERTSLDPVKEMVAHVMGKQNNVTTDADFCAKRGKDYEATYQQRARERKLARKLELPEAADATVRKKPENPVDPQQQDNATAVADLVATAVREEIRAAFAKETT